MWIQTKDTGLADGDKAFWAQGPGFLPAVGMTAGSGLVTEDTGLGDGNRLGLTPRTGSLTCVRDDRLVRV